MNSETTRLRGRPRNRCQDDVRENGRPVGVKGRRRGYGTDRKGRYSGERQGIVACCTCQWIERMNRKTHTHTHTQRHIYIYICDQPRVLVVRVFD